ncbi:hypothetical protein [Actinomyces gaoshouyii]|uniref:hypothetical protein n=1 Tax=Actinomyces gaoshouyii TaxID=1960083 RepID=UPI000F7ADF84|nr:hypothetical protein [Actinomyces gaoshouyii]
MSQSPAPSSTPFGPTGGSWSSGPGAPVAPPEPYGGYQAAHPGGYPGVAPGYGMPWRPPAVKSMTAPWVLLASGVIMIVVAIVGIILSLGAFARTVSLEPLDPDGTTAAALEGGKDYGLFGDGYASCDITGPGAVEERSVTGSVTGSVTVNDKSELLILTPSASGMYTFECSGSAQSLALGDAATVSGMF